MEENAAPGKNWKPMLAVAVVAVVVVAAVGVYWMGQSQEPVQSALGGRLLAEQTALNWSKNATLNEVRVKPGVSITYQFWDLSNNTDNHIEVTITKENEVFTQIVNPYFTFVPIENWTIDNEEAYDIASSLDEVQEIASKGELRSFYLHRVAETENPVWMIWWDYQLTDIGVCIDAISGEVLGVNS